MCDGAPKLEFKLERLERRCRTMTLFQKSCRPMVYFIFYFKSHLIHPIETEGSNNHMIFFVFTHISFDFDFL